MKLLLLVLGILFMTTLCSTEEGGKVKSGMEGNKLDNYFEICHSSVIPSRTAHLVCMEKHFMEKRVGMVFAKLQHPLRWI